MERGPQRRVHGVFVAIQAAACHLPDGVNNVQPGPTPTDMTAGLVEMVKPFVPLGRLGKPEEIAGLVAYLASAEAGFITGSRCFITGSRWWICRVMLGLRWLTATALRPGYWSLEVFRYLHFGQNELEFMNENNEWWSAKAQARARPAACVHP
jgi:hypothetical protein